MFSEKDKGKEIKFEDLLEGIKNQVKSKEKKYKIGLFD